MELYCICDSKYCSKNIFIIKLFTYLVNILTNKIFSFI